MDGDIVVDGDTTIVEVDLSALPELTTGEFYELWLLDLDNGELVSLGEVDATTTAVPIDAPVNADRVPGHRRLGRTSRWRASALR